jgi:uncharacterized membrane protein YhaH (DUF805 family)
MKTTAIATLVGTRAPVEPGLYFRVGLGLGVFKYLVDAAVIWFVAGSWIPPWTYLAPLLMFKMEYLGATSPWLVGFLVLWTLPFTWIGASMSVRRARDAGMSPLVGLLMFVPVVNYLMFIALSLAKTSQRKSPGPQQLRGTDRVVWAALYGVIGGLSVALAMVGVSVFFLHEYGATLFFGTPFVMGAVSGWLLNLGQLQSRGTNVLVGTLTVAVSGGLMLLFALEGVLCLAMAAPIALVMALAGMVMGRALAAADQRKAIVGQLGLLPLLAVAEPPPPPDLVHEISSVVVIDAPPEVVWRHVAGWERIDLPEVPAWFFRLGVAYPQSAWIDGTGVGAVRHCEFSTGTFVEPITTWDPPHRLAFDVVESPPTMHEWSPYEVVHAPHLDGILQSRRGEFRLVALEDGRTRLEGSTWYSFEMAPRWYWHLWSDALIGAIHDRVLTHVKAQAEAG